MALAITASFMGRSQLDVGWSSAGIDEKPQKYRITVRDGCGRQEWITDAAAAQLEVGPKWFKVQLNLSEIRSDTASYIVSVKGTTSSACTDNAVISACKVVESGSTSKTVSATGDATCLLSHAASVNSSDGQWLCLQTGLYNYTYGTARASSSSSSSSSYLFCHKLSKQ